MLVLLYGKGTVHVDHQLQLQTMIQGKIDADIETVQEKVLKELKMNGLVLKDKELVQKMDSSLVSIPVSFNKDGSFRKNSSVASKEQFDILNRYVKTKISHIKTAYAAVRTVGTGIFLSQHIRRRGRIEASERGRDEGASGELLHKR